VTYVRGVRDCREVGEIFFDPPDYAILNPIAADRVNLSIVVPLEDAAAWSHRLDDFFAARVRHLPHLARRLVGAKPIAPVQAMGPLAYEIVPPAIGGVLLVGDAAGFYDPLTGEGVFAALRGAELAASVAAEALAAGDCSSGRLRAYERARARAFAAKARFTRALQLVAARRRLADLMAHALARRPALLDLLLGVVGDYVPPARLLEPARWR
jgi:menaquinone-9 beta-reductase